LGVVGLLMMIGRRVVGRWIEDEKSAKEMVRRAKCSDVMKCRTRGRVDRAKRG